jgi:glycosyltransferase involved in cell wall biosynthesis
LPYKLLGVKYIFDHHDAVPELYWAKYHNKSLYHRVLGWLERLTFRCSDVVIATNESYRTLAMNRGGVDPEDIFVVRNGPDLRTFRAVAPKPALKHGKRYLVGYVGVMGVQDGLDMLLDVASYLKRRGRRDVHFTCIGDGSELNRLEKRVESEGLDGTVNFTGRISEELLLDILSTADVCVNPDTPCVMNDISTMVKIMEYMALGKPIVQCDLKEGRVSAAESSLYADNSDPVPDFACKILWLLDNPEEARRMGEFGKRRVESALAWGHSVQKLLAAYERAFCKRRKGVPLSAQG